MNAPISPTQAELLRAMQQDSAASDELAAVTAILGREVSDRRPWMRYGIVGSAGFFMLAVAAALAGWPESLVYLLAGGCLGALAWGAWRGSLPRRRHERSVLAELALLPLPVLARATVSEELPEASRVLIVNLLNRNYPGWTVDFDAADPDWRALKNARGRAGGCGSGCGGRCG